MILQKTLLEKPTIKNSSKRAINNNIEISPQF